YPFLLAGLAALVYGWILLRSDKLPACPLSQTADKLAACRYGQERFRENVELALLFLFLTLAHPRAWRCNFVALVLPCVLLAEQVRLRRPGWRVGLGALGLVVLACGWPTNGLGEEGWTWGAWLLQGKHFWGAVGLGAACGLASPLPGPSPH